jgi:magnesium-transporting ATPase (P-type)
VVRPEAAEAVALLRRAGVGVAMLTGDARGAAAGAAAAAGIPAAAVFAELLPQEKLDKVWVYPLFLLLISFCQPVVCGAALMGVTARSLHSARK